MLNLTPHAIIIVDAEGKELISFQPSGYVARLQTFEEEVDLLHCDGVCIPVVAGGRGQVMDIPENKNIKFLVSGIVLDALGPEYHGLAFAPDTGKSVVRNSQGHIIGVTRLRTVAK